MAKFGFDKRIRLSNADDFSSVFSKANIKTACPELLILARFNSHDHPRLGIVVAKKHVRLASQRNRIKRLIRESFRLQQYQLPHVDIVVLARKGASEVDNPTFDRLLQKQWNRLSKRAGTLPEQTA